MKQDILYSTVIETIISSMKANILIVSSALLQIMVHCSVLQAN